MASAPCRSSILLPPAGMFAAANLKPKFDAAFLSRRMAAHRAWQEAETRRLCDAVLDEVGVKLPYRKLRTRPLPFEEES